MLLARVLALRRPRKDVAVGLFHWTAGVVVGVHLNFKVRRHRILDRWPGRQSSCNRRLLDLLLLGFTSRRNDSRTASSILLHLYFALVLRVLWLVNPLILMLVDLDILLLLPVELPSRPRIHISSLLVHLELCPFLDQSFDERVALHSVGAPDLHLGLAAARASHKVYIWLVLDDVLVFKVHVFDLLTTYSRRQALQLDIDELHIPL